MSKTYALITGASSGIGLEIARQLAARRIAEGGDYVILGKPSRISDYTPHFLWHVRVDKDPAVQWLRGMFLSEKGRYVDPDDYQSLEP